MDKYSASLSKYCLEAVKINNKRNAGRKSWQKISSDVDVSDNRWTLSQSPETKVGRRRQEMFTHDKVWRMTFRVRMQQTCLLQKLKRIEYVGACIDALFSL